MDRVAALGPGCAASPDLAQEIIAFGRCSLAAYKCPRAVDFVDDIPRSDAGKVQRKAARDRWAGRSKSI